MNTLIRLTLLYLVAGLLLGWALRAGLRRLDRRRAGWAVMAVALAPFALHALDTAVRIAPRGGAAAAVGYALAALVLAVAGGVFAWRWRSGPRLALLPPGLVALALPASWILGSALRRAGETTDAIPLLVYVGASLVAAVTLLVARLQAPSLPGALRRRGGSGDGGADHERDEGARGSPARTAGRLVSALLRRLRR